MRTSAEVTYFDSSALVKLVAHEIESPALWRYVRSRLRRASSAIVRVEVLRAVRHLGPSAVTLARKRIGDLELIRVDDAVLEDAAELAGPDLRSLDAIHLAAARALGDGLDALVTYDVRMAAAAKALGLRVAAP